MINDKIKDRGDWLVDAVATATQNRQFLRGEPECDSVACEAIRMNGEEAMRQIAKPLTDRIEELEAKLAKATGALERIVGGEFDGVLLLSLPPQDAAKSYAAGILAELKGDKEP